MILINNYHTYQNKNIYYSFSGYFRDEKASYDLIVYLLCFISFLCALMMLLLPHIERREQDRKATALN